MTTIAISKTLRPDNKGRICLSSFLTENISSFKAYLDKNHRIILEPFAEIPAKELWLHQNPKAMASVKKGLKQSSKNKVKSLGSFS
ncbi:MAG: hypothetical protein V4612_03495 [Pseudomonadota bacterium]